MQMRTLSAFVPLLMLGLFVNPALAIIDGEVDTENKFPNVGTVVVISQNGVPIPPNTFGTGSLIHPRVFLTAGHTTAEAEAGIAIGAILLSDARVSFATDPFDPASWLEIEAIVTHPDFTFDKGFGHANDIGVLILKEPVEDIEPVKLAPVGYLDELRKIGALGDANSATVTIVGYGAGLLFPPPRDDPQGSLRRFTEAVVANFSKWLTIAQNPGADGGGANHGDSGGPAFWIDAGTDVQLQVGVASWTSATSVGVEHYARIDLPAARTFIDAVIADVEADDAP